MRRTGGELARLPPREVAQVSRRLSEHSKKAERNQDINRFRNGPEAPRLRAGGAMVRNRILVVAGLVVPLTLLGIRVAPPVAQPTLTAAPGAALPGATVTVSGSCPVPEPTTEPTTVPATVPTKSLAPATV